MMNLVLLSLFVHLATASIDTSVCSQPAAPAPTYQRPILPPTFEVHIECIIVDKNLTTEVHELYDQDTNQGKLRQAIDGTHFTAYYNYATNEFLGVYPETRQCSVSDLSTSDQRFLLGYNATGLPKGEGRIYSAAAALHFGGAMERYIGKDAIRGINVDKWYSCQYWPGLDASMKVTWYFSDPNTWNMALALDAIPVRAWVKGKVGKDGESAPHNFEHYYDFMHFKPYIEDTDSFEAEIQSDDYRCKRSFVKSDIYWDTPAVLRETFYVACNTSRQVHVTTQPIITLPSGLYLGKLKKHL